MGLVTRDDGWRMPDWLWERIEPLIPEPVDKHPLGCHRPRVPNRGAMDAILPKLPALFDRTGMTPEDPERGVPGIERDQVEALILAAEGHGDQAVALARKAAAGARSLPYAFGPPYPEKPSFELLGEILLREHRAQEAQQAFQQALLLTPRRTESLLGLLQASRALGDQATAAEAQAELRKIRHAADHPQAEMR